MSPPPHDSASNLEKLARERFSNLTEAETKLLRAASTGDTARCGVTNFVHDVLNDPSSAETWGAERQIRAELVRWMCADPTATNLVDPFGLHVYAARLKGNVDLSYLTVPFPLTFANCFLEGELNLRHSDLLNVNLQGTRTIAISADGATVKSGVFLRYGFHSSGPVRFLTTRIGGNFECDGSRFGHLGDSNATEPALALDGAIVKGSIFLRNGFEAVGEVRLMGTQIGGCLDCTNASFKSSPTGGVEDSGKALSAEGLVVSGPVSIHAVSPVEGEVSFVGARVGSTLTFGSIELSNQVAPMFHGVLTCDRIVVQRGVFFCRGVCVVGEVRFLGAQIDADFDCDGAQFRAVTPEAADDRCRSMSCQTTVVRGNVHLRNGFHAQGTTSFNGSQVDGNFDCTGGAF